MKKDGKKTKKKKNVEKKKEDDLVSYQVRFTALATHQPTNHDDDGGGIVVWGDERIC